MTSQLKTYYPALNGIRFWAALTVMASHTGIDVGFNIAEIAVWTFFVLSGFLITGNLLKDKADLDLGVNPFAKILKNFYIKRIFRIFPLYYATLLFVPLLMVNTFDFSSQLKWFYTFLTNFYVMHNGWPGCYSHLWTIAVEEQFYLMWPVLILIVPVKYLKYLLISTLMAAIVFRIAITIIHPLNYTDIVYIHPLACIDFFGIGGIIAYLQSRNVVIPLKIVIAGALILTGIYGIALFAASIPYFNIINPAWVGIILFLCISWAIQGIHSPFSFIVCHPVIQHLGKVSYGIYLFHNFIYDFSIRVFQKFTALNWISEMPSSGVFFAVVSFFSVAAALLSWSFIEIPMMKLREKVLSKTSISDKDLVIIKT